MRILLVHCDHRPFEKERFGLAWRRAGGDAAELVPVAPSSAPTVLAEGRAWHGLLLTGGPDVEPWRFGQAPGAGVELHPDRHRDALDLDLLARAAAARWPVLAICYGCQILAVAYAGTLIQDLPAAGLPGHSPGLPPDAVAHSVQVASSARWLPAGREMAVNSRHHQAIADPGRLRVVATAPDGVIEAVEGTDLEHFLLGVQWHPEQVETEPHVGIFRAFRGACRMAESHRVSRVGCTLT